MIWLSDDPDMFDLDGWRRRVALLEEIGADLGDEGRALAMAKSEVRRLEGDPDPVPPIFEIMSSFD